mmetsp:Transcript_2455/g.7832  ORF Transcript_2455/g.7832 Transcript_2455/m.7832 type:complete len:218 (-) Transcript_2455:206-859(-)
MSEDPRVFFDVEIDGRPAGRLTVQLFEQDYTAVCRNVASLCTGIPPSAPLPPTHHTAPPTTGPWASIPPSLIDTTFEGRAKGVGGGADPCWGYQGASFDRLVPDALAQVQAVSSGNGSVSVFGPPFLQAFPPTASSLAPLVAQSRGFVGAAAHEDGTLASEFFVTLAPTPWLDPTETIIFGRVVDGLAVLDLLNKVPVDEETETPKLPIVIAQCGQW